MGKYFPMGINALKIMIYIMQKILKLHDACLSKNEKRKE